MGADFMFTRFPRFDMTPEREDQFEDTLHDILSDPNREVEFMEWFMYECDEDDNSRNMVFQEVNGALIIIADFADNDREVCAVRDFTENGYAYFYYTGGLSWGDEPTEMYTHLNVAGFFPEIYELALKYAQQDYNLSTQEA